MGKRGVYIAVLAACMLGMAACADREKDGMAMPETQGQVTADGADGLEGQDPADGQQGQDLAGGQPESRPESTEESETESTEESETESSAEGLAESQGQDPAESLVQDIQELDGSLYVHKEEETEEYKAEDGTVLLTVEKSLPVVVISGREQAAGEINEYIREKGAFGQESLLSEMSEEEVLEMAEMYYEEAGKDNWVGAYILSVGYYLGRMDDSVVSFQMMSYYYLGGAHPNTTQIGLTFDAQTGKRLMLADVVEDEEAASAAVMEFLLEETGKEEYGGVFFPDYEKYLGDLFADSTWYLGEDGFHIIANTYSIAPYVAGSFDFAIPYGQADFLKEEYR